MKIVQARRVALAAQQIGQNRDRKVTMRHVDSAVDALAQFQIDSVNVLARAHFMPLFTRLGKYDVSLLTQAASQSHRRLFEYWGHAASMIDVELYPALRFRMTSLEPWHWNRMKMVLAEHPAIIEETLEIVNESGPMTPRDLATQDDKPKGSWWNWSTSKTVMEWLFHSGKISVVGRNAQFERIFDVSSRVIPADLFNTREMDLHESHVELVRRAARALGIGTVRCLADYFRTDTAPTRAAITALEATGELERVEVEGWKDPAWMWSQARGPRITTSALVSPFDSLAFERKRLKALFDIDYTISLYTPAAQRIHGYYVYLFLLDESFVARVDLKADRKAKALIVQSAWLEASAEHQRARVAAELDAELRRAADWLALDEVRVIARGDLAGDLTSS